MEPLLACFSDSWLAGVSLGNGYRCSSELLDARDCGRLPGVWTKVEQPNTARKDGQHFEFVPLRRGPFFVDPAKIS